VADSKITLAGKRCLVLDDEILIALDIQQMLETAGAASVICVVDAASALAALRGASKFDIAVLDVVLGGTMITSLAVAAVLREQRTPFVFITGMLAEDLQHTTQFPDVPIVEKPYPTALLLEALLRALDGR
jgi:CheY-like chemotaxis protein